MNPKVKAVWYDAEVKVLFMLVQHLDSIHTAMKHFQYNPKTNSILILNQYTTINEISGSVEALPNGTLYLDFEGFKALIENLNLGIGEGYHTHEFIKDAEAQMLLNEVFSEG